MEKPLELNISGEDGFKAGWAIGFNDGAEHPSRLGKVVIVPSADSAWLGFRYAEFTRTHGRKAADAWMKEASKR